MNDIFTLLNINKEQLDAFQHQAGLVENYQLERSIANNLRRLKVIEDSLQTDTNIAPPDRSIEKVMERVRLESQHPAKRNSEWTFHDLRTVSYYLSMIHDDEKAFDYALNLLDNNWRNLFFNGLVFYLLNGWLNIEPSYKNKTCKLLKSKLEGYKDSNKKYLILKNHANFFEDNGPTRLTSLIKAKSDSIMNAPTYLGYKSKSIALSYYSDCIVTYFKDCSVESLNGFEEILAYHDLDRTKKLVLANLVEKVDKEGNQIEQTQVGLFSSRILGDIGLSTTWAPFQGATEMECQKLSHAKSLVNAWYARKVIDVFFERCVQDENRKDFWLNYIPYFTDFRIVGSLAVKTSIESDPRLEGIMDRFFVQTRSLKNRTSALVFKMKNKIFVEFSDVGSLYVYNDNYQPCEAVFKKNRIDALIDSLKRPYMYWIIDLSTVTSSPKFDSRHQKYEYEDYSSYSEEGRLAHSQNWQLRIYAWIRHMLDIKPDIPEYSRVLPRVGTITVAERFPFRSEELSNKCYIVSENYAFWLFSPFNGRLSYLRGLEDNEEEKGTFIFKQRNPHEFMKIYHVYNNKKSLVADIQPYDEYIDILKNTWYSYIDHFYIK